MKILTTLFIWLLMSLVPLQGMAANALLICKAANQASMASSAPSASDADMHAYPCHDAGAVQDDSELDGDTMCMVHVAGAPWMPPGDHRLPVLQAPAVAVNYIGFHIPFFVPDGLDRPPRTHSL